jgi:hypothetical protein
LKIAGCGTFESRRCLRGRAIALAPSSSAGPAALPAASRVASVLATALRQHDHIGAHSLGDRFELGFADVRPEDPQIAAFYSKNRKTRPARPFIYMAPLTYKDFCHADRSFR